VTMSRLFDSSLFGSIEADSLADLGTMSVNIGSRRLNRIIYSFVSFVNYKSFR
jgi:hypothetical protein